MARVMDPDVAELVREQRLLEAARLSSDRGDAHHASLLYEQACAWRPAAAEAMRAGDAGRALKLAVYGGDEPTAQQALAIVTRAEATAVAAANELARLGHHAWAARALEGGGRTIDAAKAWQRAGEPRRAAALLEGVGAAAEAARVLDAALAARTLDAPHAGAIAVDLARLLGRLGRWDAAARVLQRIPADAPARREALGLLANSLERLGLARAAAEVRAELAALAAPPGSRDRAASEPAPSPATRLFGRYAVVGEIASSASARVLACVDDLLGEPVAIKIFAVAETGGANRDARARFERDVRAVRLLDHPCIVPIRAYFPRGPATVVARMAGGNLEERLATGALAPGRAVEIACAVLSALAAAHRVGVLHRDVKPANVLFDAVGGARLGDFGAAHLADVSTTATAGLLGALAYLGPEQREGRPATVRSDLFAVGVMLREMLTGEPALPYEPSRTRPSEVHRGLDARHDAAVSRMCAVDPEQRPADASEAEALLGALPWPGAAGPTRARTPAGHGATQDVEESRAGQRPDGTPVDRWLSRDFESVLLTDTALARARSFAQADHMALQAVWRVDEDGGTIWLERLEGRALDRALTEGEQASLREGLGALHAAGGVHGRVDRQHVVLAATGAVLRFEADHDAAATTDRDRAQLARLAAL